MSALPHHFFTPEEYLELECHPESKSQYVDGENFAMAGTPLLQNEIAGNVYTALKNRLLASAARMRVEHHKRRPSGVWAYEEYEHPSNRLRLDGVDCQVPLEEIYSDVIFEP